MNEVARNPIELNGKKYELIDVHVNSEGEEEYSFSQSRKNSTNTQEVRYVNLETLRNIVRAQLHRVHAAGERFLRLRHQLVCGHVGARHAIKRHI
jgi:hypothetical protein